MKASVATVAIAALALVVLLNPVWATQDRFGCHITIIPGNPTASDEIDASVGFLFRTCPPLVTEFGPLFQEGNVFSIYVAIMAPKPEMAVLQIIHSDNHTYNLGRLEAGSYTFEVYAKAQGEDVASLQEEVEFTVAPSYATAPEFPSLVSVLLLLSSITVITVAPKLVRKLKSLNIL